MISGTVADITAEELESLVSLLDDRDTVVAECVDRRLKSFGLPIVRTLSGYAADGKGGASCTLAREKAEALNVEFRLDDFRDLLQRQKGPLSIFEASFITSSMFNCDLRRDWYEDMFFKCSGEYLAEHSDRRTGVENIRIFNHIFFHRLGFTVYDVDLTQEEYAFFDRTFKSRQGNPFVIAGIYFMIAQVAGLPLGALCFPGGFVPVYMENGRELFYINVYRGGEIFLKDRLGDFLKATGLGLSLNSFKVKEDSTAIAIWLESLLFLYSNRKDEKKCSVIERALDCLGPERFLTVDEEDI